MEDINTPQIGPVLQRQRKGRGLTLQQLAATSGVSKSMLSQIERGQANPTFAVLWSLTRALKIEFADLLGGEANAPDDDAIELVAASHIPEIRSGDGACRLRILSPPRLAGEMEWYDVEIAPSGVLESAPHMPGAFEHFTAFTDGFEVTSGHSTRILQAGDTARYPADVPHRIVNRSGQVARGLMILLYRSSRSETA
ncbi:MAG: helix-turn-helix transcriptional regulator [Rhizobiales bacterium]|nr:helix-turn-helix transcriptional regulator [Hyphomicrobiales bacterium]